MRTRMDFLRLKSTPNGALPNSHPFRDGHDCFASLVCGNECRCPPFIVDFITATFGPNAYVRFAEKAKNRVRTHAIALPQRGRGFAGEVRLDYCINREIVLILGHFSFSMLDSYTKTGQRDLAVP